MANSLNMLHQQSNRGFRSVLALAFCIALAGCNAATTPSTAPTIPNISGDYAGTMNDAQGGNSTATATLAQHSTAVGGAIAATQSGAAVNAQLSLIVNSADAFSGTFVIDYLSGATCTFSTSGSYNPNSYALDGSYTAVTGCSGDTGTYALTQQCTDTVTSLRRRPQTLAGPAQC